MNRQDAKNAKKEKRKKKEERELTCWKPVLRSIFSFFSLFLWRSWRLGGSFG